MTHEADAPVFILVVRPRPSADVRPGKQVDRLVRVAKAAGVDVVARGELPEGVPFKAAVEAAQALAMEGAD